MSRWCRKLTSSSLPVIIAFAVGAPALPVDEQRPDTALRTGDSGVEAARKRKVKKLAKAAAIGAVTGIVTGPLLLGLSIAEGAAAGAGKGVAFEVVKPGRLLKKLKRKLSRHRHERSGASGEGAGFR